MRREMRREKSMAGETDLLLPFAATNTPVNNRTRRDR